MCFSFFSTIAVRPRSLPVHRCSFFLARPLCERDRANAIRCTLAGVAEFRLAVSSQFVDLLHVPLSAPTQRRSVPCVRPPVAFSRAASMPLHIASKLLILNRHEIIPFTASPLFSRQKQQSLNQRVQGSSPCAPTIDSD